MADAVIVPPKYTVNVLENEMLKVSARLTYDSSPFYASVLMQCARIWSHEVPTLCVAVSQQVLLIINPDFFMGTAKVKDKKTGQEIEVGCKSTLDRMGVIEHEILHLVLYHLSRGQRLSDRKLGNIAMDAIVNQFVRFKLPGDYIKHDRYNLPADKDLDFYYNALREMQKQQGEGDGQQQQSGASSSSPSSSGSKGGKKQQQQQSGKGGDQLQKDMNDDFSSQENGRGGHDSWTHKDDKESGGNEKGADGDNADGVLKRLGMDDGGISEAARESIVTDVVRQAANRDRSALGKLPGAIAGHIEEMLKPKKASQPWNVILRRFIGTHGSSIVRSSMKYTSKRYRDPISGLKLRPGLRIKRQKKILFAIDTSGSMSTKDLELCAGELSLIWRYNKDITVLECDTQINRRYKFTGELKMVCGRGGTDMKPVREVFEKEDFDCCILLTDGAIGEIGERAPRKGWLWVLTHGGGEPCNWGSYIYLPDADTIEYAK